MPWLDAYSQGLAAFFDVDVSHLHLDWSEKLGNKYVKKLFEYEHTKNICFM